MECAQMTAKVNQTLPNDWLAESTWEALFQFSNKSVVKYNLGTNYIQQPLLAKIHLYF